MYTDVQQLSKEKEPSITSQHVSNPKNMKAKNTVIKKEESHEKTLEKHGKQAKLKKEKSAKAKKIGTEKSVSKDVVPKPELIIPEIVIPVNKPVIKRKNGPSPWNGTIKYENKIFLGAHISAAGLLAFIIYLFLHD